MIIFFLLLQLTCDFSEKEKQGLIFFFFYCEHVFLLYKNTNLCQGSNMISGPLISGFFQMFRYAAHLLADIGENCLAACIVSATRGHRYIASPTYIDSANLEFYCFCAMFLQIFHHFLVQNYFSVFF